MRSLRAQLSLTVAVVVLCTVAIISFLSNLLIHRQFEKYVSEQSKMKTANIVENLGHQYNRATGIWNQETIHAVGMYALYDGYIIKVYDNHGAMVWDAENHDMTLCAQMMQEIAQRMAQYGNTGQFILQEYRMTQNEQTVGTVSIRYYTPFYFNEIDFVFLQALNTILLSTGIFSLLLSFGAGWLLAKRITHPITKTVNVAKQISAGNYEIRFEGKTSSIELHELGSSINHLAGMLGKQEHLRAQLTSDVAHELRTPLATLETHLEAMIEEVWEPTPERLKSCHEEIVRLGKIVADLERLEKIENENLTLHKAPTDLMAVMRTVCGNFESELSKKNLKLVQEGGSCIANVDRDRISGVLTNLLSNSVKYTPSGGEIHISVEERGHEAIVTIADTGIGIPEGELPFVFERFFRADKSRNRGTGGAGIGLAIVKSIVHAHGGNVAAQSVVDQGSRFVVTLPR